MQFNSISSLVSYIRTLENAIHYTRILVIPLLFSGYFLLPTVMIFAQPDLIPDWKTDTLTPGLVHKYTHTSSVFDSWQNLNVLEVDLTLRRLGILYEEMALKPTSVMAGQSNALAAVNGGFFDIQKGGSVTRLMIGGKIIHETQEDLLRRNSEISRAAIYFTDGVAGISHSGRENWAFVIDSVENVMVTGPILIYENEAMDLASTPFNLNRHPRTGACLTDDHTFLLITADGRNSQAYGLSLPELTTILQDLNCRYAINLDGGGSTTMWIQQKGIVNKPSDNRTFDGEGERPVANALAVFE